LDSMRAEVLRTTAAGPGRAAKLLNEDTQEQVKFLADVQRNTDAARDAAVEGAEAKKGGAIFGEDEWDYVKDTFGGLSGDVSSLGLAGLVAEAQKGGIGREEEFQTLFKGKTKQLGEGYFEYKKAIAKKFEGLTDRQKEMLQKVKKGTSLSQVRGLAAGQQWERTRNDIAGTIDTLSAGKVNTANLDISDPMAIAKRFTPEMRKRLKSEGGAFESFGDTLTGMEARIKEQGSPLSESQIDFFTKKLHKMSAGAGEVTESVAGVARGSAAERAAAAGKVASAGQAEYTQALRTFAEAAPIFLRAVEGMEKESKDPSIGEAAKNLVDGADILLTTIKALPGKLISGDGED